MTRSSTPNFTLLVPAGLVPAVFASALGLLAPTAGHAADCLTRLDGMVVAYDLPAGPGAGASGTGGQAPGEEAGTQKQTKLYAGEVGMPHTTPPGRAGMAQLVGPGPVQPTLPERNPLSASQRSRLIDILRQARAAEAMGDETACSGLLDQAQSVVAPHG